MQRQSVPSEPSVPGTTPLHTGTGQCENDPVSAPGDPSTAGDAPEVVAGDATIRDEAAGKQRDVIDVSWDRLDVGDDVMDLSGDRLSF